MSEQRATYADLPAWVTTPAPTRLPRVGIAIASGEMVLCARCHKPRHGAKLVCMVGDVGVSFVPESWCGCDTQEKEKDIPVYKTMDDVYEAMMHQGEDRW